MKSILLQEILSSEIKKVKYNTLQFQISHEMITVPKNGLVVRSYMISLKDLFISFIMKILFYVTNYYQFLFDLLLNPIYQT